jgi:hypothetical protein
LYLRFSLTIDAMRGPMPPSCAWPNASLRSGFGHEIALRVLQAFGHADAAVAECLRLRLDLREERSPGRTESRGTAAASGIGVSASSAMPTAAVIHPA